MRFIPIVCLLFVILPSCEKDAPPLTVDRLLGSYRGFEMTVRDADGQTLSVAELNGPDLTLRADGGLTMNEYAASWSLENHLLIVNWPTVDGEAIDSFTVHLSDDQILSLRKTDVSAGPPYALFDQPAGARVYTTVRYAKME